MPLQKRTLFLGDLPIFCSEQDLDQLFSPYGEIYEIRLKRDADTNRNLSYGFIKFVIPACASLALQDLDGYLLHGRAMKVRWASKSGNDDDNKTAKTIQLHVSYVSRQVSLVVNENSLRTLFSGYGEVLDVSIKQSSIIKENSQTQSGYGFVHFPNTEVGVRSAMAAVAAFHNVTVDEVTYDCHLSHRFNEVVKNPQSSSNVVSPNPSISSSQAASLGSPPQHMGTTSQQMPPPPAFVSQVSQTTATSGTTDCSNNTDSNHSDTQPSPKGPDDVVEPVRTVTTAPPVTVPVGPNVVNGFAAAFNGPRPAPLKLQPPPGITLSPNRFSPQQQQHHIPPQQQQQHMSLPQQQQQHMPVPQQKQQQAYVPQGGQQHQMPHQIPTTNGQNQGGQNEYSRQPYHQQYHQKQGHQAHQQSPYQRSFNSRNQQPGQHGQQQRGGAQPFNQRQQGQQLPPQHHHQQQQTPFVPPNMMPGALAGPSFQQYQQPGVGVGYTQQPQVAQQHMPFVAVQPSSAAPVSLQQQQQVPFGYNMLPLQNQQSMSQQQLQQQQQPPRGYNNVGVGSSYFTSAGSGSISGIPVVHSQFFESPLSTPRNAVVGMLNNGSAGANNGNISMTAASVGPGMDYYAAAAAGGLLPTPLMYHQQQQQLMQQMSNGLTSLVPSPSNYYVNLQQQQPQQTGSPAPMMHLATPNHFQRTQQQQMQQQMQPIQQMQMQQQPVPQYFLPADLSGSQSNATSPVYAQNGGNASQQGIVNMNKGTPMYGNNNNNYNNSNNNSNSNNRLPQNMPQTPQQRQLQPPAVAFQQQMSSPQQQQQQMYPQQPQQQQQPPFQQFQQAQGQQLPAQNSPYIMAQQPQQSNYPQGQQQQMQQLPPQPYQQQQAQAQQQLNRGYANNNNNINNNTNAYAQPQY